MTIPAAIGASIATSAWVLTHEASMLASVFLRAEGSRLRAGAVRPLEEGQVRAVVPPPLFARAGQRPGVNCLPLHDGSEVSENNNEILAFRAYVTAQRRLPPNIAALRRCGSTLPNRRACPPAPRTNHPGPGHPRDGQVPFSCSGGGRGPFCRRWQFGRSGEAGRGEQRVGG